MSLSQLLPDTRSLLAQRDGAQSGAGQLVASLGGLVRGGADSPVGAVVGVLGDVRAKLDIDVSGLTTELPRAIATVRNAIPAGVVEHIAAIDTYYTQARTFLHDSPVARAVSSGDLQGVALATIDDALGLFRTRLATLVEGAFGAEELAEIADVLAAFERFHGDFAAHRDELGPFLARYLVGVAPDLLQAPLASLDATLAALAPAASDALDATLAPARDALDAAYAELFAAIGALDPSKAAGYTRIGKGLDVVETATNALLAALPPAYAAARAAVDSPVWGQALAAYATTLGTVSLDRVPSIDDVVDTIGAALDDLLARLLMALGPEDVSARLQAMNAAIRNAFLTSPLGQVRRTLAGFLDQIRAAVEQIPTEAIGQIIEQMLQRVRQELEQLGIAQIGAQITQAFDEARSFIVAQLNEQVVARVAGALRGLADQARALPIADLVANLNGAIAQLQNAITQIEQLVAEQIDALRGVLAQLDTLSYEPISNEVIGEIDQIKAKLAAINPNALSAPEKLAIQGALAVLDAIDLKSQVADQLKPAYHNAEAEVKHLLDDITAALHQFRDQIGVFSPDALLGPMNALLAQVTGALDKANGRVVIAPLDALVGELVAQLERISPAQLLDPLQAPYDAMMAVVNQLDPARLLAPLNAIYAEIDRLINLVDITPLLAELDRRRAALFAEARQRVLDGVAALNLPEPLAGFLAAVTPLITALADAVLGDPAEALPQVALDLRSRFHLSSLFAPLDSAFDRLAGLLDELPPDDVVAALDAVRVALGVGLDRLDPARLAALLRDLRAGLAAHSPAQLLGGPLRLPTLRAAFEARVAVAPPARQDAIVALRARFEAVVQITLPGAPGDKLQPIQAQHDALLASLDRQLDQPALGDASAAYDKLRSQLGRLLPPFLRSTAPLTYDAVRQGIAAMRPGAKAARLDAKLELFATRVQPLADQMADLSNGFFAALRDAVQLLNPLTLRDHVAAIYDAVRARVRVLDPEALATSLRTDLLEPLLAPLAAINPAAIKAQLQTLYDAVLAALRNGARAVFAPIGEAVDALLATMREQVRGLLDQVKSTLGQALHAVEDVLGQLEGLVFVEILGRLRSLIDKLGASFDKELDRILNAFDQMLHAAPTGAGTSRSVGV